MANSDVASVLEETADLIELTDGNPHRARAFSRASRAVSDLDTDVAARVHEDTLTDMGGIGDAMAEHIADVVRTGTFPLHDELLNAVPPGLLDVLRVKGLGTKRTRRLWQELNITSLDDLEAAAENDRITSLSGFGDKTQSNILENVRRLRSYENQWRLADAHSAVAPLLEALRDHPDVNRAEPTGALRRHCETMEEVALIAVSSTPSAVATWLSEQVDTDVANSDGVMSTTLPEGIPLRLHLATPDDFGTTWWRTTGSEAHCTSFEDTYGAPGAHPTENALFAAAGLSPIAAPLREDRGELAAATDNSLPDLIQVEDLQGCLHNHSTYSDGAASLETMTTAARRLGFSYFGICDHSQSLQIAQGLSPDEVRAQHEEVQQINEDLDEESFTLFHGIESDVLTDGSLDYDDEILSLFDLVVASVHTGFNMTEEEATERVLRAVQNPHTRILGHPTGRLLLSRDGYPLNHERVIAACAEHDVAIELNANPYRLDLDWHWVRHATDRGVLISINPDAHSTDDLEYVRWGVQVAQKGWLTPSDCLNAKSLSAFEDWLARG